MTDGTIHIAIGRTARSKVWQNQKTTWKNLVERLENVTRTSETLAEYKKANREERGKIKDVGGYVGGYLRGGRRKPENVGHRQLITLDLDFATLEVWEDFTLLFDNAAVLHSTHSHTEETPKYRLIMPLDKEVSADQYAAISRRIAGDLGIEYFDNTGFQPYRLMFWPSVSSDAEYSFNFQDGPFIDTDKILATYTDWRDSSLYPISDQYADSVKKLTEKQQDPELKRGIIGAFCRTYSISEAIDIFLKDHYVEAGDGRYTYLKGSTSSGLVLYEDKFAYSHHGSDPISGQLCNAFDLLRVHLYGHLDEGTQTTNITKKLSFKSMEEFARTDKKVRLTIAAENLNSARYDFDDDWDEEDLEVSKEDLQWAEDLEIDGRGKYLSSATNINLILQNDTRLIDAFKYNSFDNKRYIVKSLPWRKIKVPEPIRDVDFSGVRNYIETIYGIVGKSKIDDALALEFERRSFHPVQDYLSAVKWDNIERVDTLLIEYFGADDNQYTREAIRKMLVGAVARIFDNGCKFDTALVLVGNQGDGKSTFISKLGGAWFSDSFTTMRGKEAFEQLQGAWLVEMAELSALRKSDIEAIKHFLTKQEDTYRPAYGRTVETFKRQCVFFGTTNKYGFLNDPSGNRRFMPIDTNMAKATRDIFKMSQYEIDLIWAEAVQLYKDGETLYLSPVANQIALIEQRNHGDVDQRAGLVEKYLATPLPSNWDTLDIYDRRNYLQTPNEDGKQREAVCVAEIWSECLGKNPEDMDRYKTRDLNGILRALDGWEAQKSAKNFKIYGNQRYYKRTEEDLFN